MQPLKTLFASLGLGRKPVPTLDPAAARWHRRTVYFPDSSVRDEAPIWLGTFDPFSLKYTSNIDAKYLDVSDLLLRGKLDEARDAVEDATRWMRPEAKTQYLLQVTTGLHELRHFHDAFGTTFGFRRLLQTIRDASEFHKMLEELKERKIGLKLPLLKWGRQGDAPEVLKKYVQSRRQFVEWLHYQDADLPLMPMPAEAEADMAATIFAIGGVQFNLPGVPRSVKEAATGRNSLRYAALGGLPILEGNAFLAQRKVARHLLRDKYKDELEIFIRRGSGTDDYWLHYTTIDAYLTRRLETFYDRFQMIYSDLALMPEDSDDDHHTHPGWRLELIVAAARGVGGKQYQQEGIDAADYMDKITAHLGWPSMLEVTQRAIREAEEKLAELDQPERKTGFWSTIMAAMYRSHLFFLKGREKAPDVMADPYLYFKIIGTWFDLLPPPALQQNDQLVFHGVRQEDAAAFRNWFLFEHMQRQLLFSTRLPCANRDLPHVCPGDPIGARRWHPADTCPFSRFIEWMGLAGMKIETRW